MPAIMIRCPQSGRSFSTGIETEPSELERFPNIRSRAWCPLCRTEHTWIAREAWIDGAFEPRMRIVRAG